MIDDNAGLTGDLDISGNVIITGAGVGLTTIENTTRFGTRSFDVHSEASVGLSNLTLRSDAASIGGGIRNAGHLSLSRIEITGATATRGGALVNRKGAEATIVASLFRDNTSNTSGGAIDNQGALDIRFSTFSGNAALSGSAIHNASSGVGSITNVTVADNIASETAAVVNASGGHVQLTNTIIARNSGPNRDVGGDFSSTHSLIGIADGATGFDEATDNNITGTRQAPVSARLGELGDFGGPTDSYRPARNSAAIDAGLDRFEDAIHVASEERRTTNISGDDQRGVRRPQPTDATLPNPIDIGSVEVQFDRLNLVEAGSTVTLRESDPGFTLMRVGQSSDRFVNPHRSLSIRTTLSGQDTGERFRIGKVSSGFVVNIDTSDSDVMELLPGASLTLPQDYELRGELRSFVGDGQIVVTTGSFSLADPTLVLTGSSEIGESYKLIDNQTSEPITGQFRGLPEGSTAEVDRRRFVISYQGGDGNDVVLTELKPTVAEILYFSAATDDGQRELYVSDGTPDGTNLVKDLSGLTSSNPKNLTLAGNTLFFTATAENGEVELYKRRRH